ncbi:MAG: hypothetical protein M9909_01220 [Thermomicrobiales bacterium]|nr:hypothetical protein [Thermomicrobiales bacterium]
MLSGNQVTPIFDENNWAGEPQSNLWFGKTDDLWNFGKPAGWGGPWYRDVAEAGVPSDAYLMTGFDKKVVHFSHTLLTSRSRSMSRSTSPARRNGYITVHLRPVRMVTRITHLRMASAPIGCVSPHPRPAPPACSSST